MKLRTLKRRPRPIMVCRSGGWGQVIYVGKRAYHWGQHCPARWADLARTAWTNVGCWGHVHLLHVPRDTAGTWATKSADEVLADVKAAMKDVYERPAEEISREMWDQLTPSQQRAALNWHRGH